MAQRISLHWFFFDHVRAECYDTIPMSDIKKITEAINAFRDERDWRQFHNPKDMALSLTLEATELLEHFQWKNGDVLDQYIADNKEDIADELADVLYWTAILADDLDVDLMKAFERKMEKTRAKYPVEKAKGTSKKYTDL